MPKISLTLCIFGRLGGVFEIGLGCLAMLTGSSALLRSVGVFLVIEVGCEEKRRRR